LEEQSIKFIDLVIARSKTAIFSSEFRRNEMQYFRVRVFLWVTL